ncbi:MAG: SDR family NAD(P)-dependent oxidoreductase [bacterium]|jgi:NAD(P)-dependent dehydrogenase (short-subunit alcohol dehydrogenase family)|tara:strand:+ start:2729 stop:3451 length:723 start_codon:yes stop_codon:yes gene_type:complete
MDPKKVILITGAGRGLGAAVAEYMSSQGLRIILADKNKIDLRELNSKNILSYQVDVSKRQEVKDMFASAYNRFKQIDYLINFAGINRDGPFLEMTEEDWDSVVSVHLKGTFICCQEFAKLKSQSSRHIINISAACGIQGRKNGVNFCSAKAGVLAFTKCLALELSPSIQVNCLIPSAVDTPEVRERYKLDTKEGFDSVVKGIPMERLGKTQDVIRMVDCILSSEFTTGSTFYVNGGEYMN